MTLWKSELKCLLQLAVPVIVSNLLTLLLSMVDLLFVGQKLGAESLAAAVRPFWLHIGWFHLNHQALGNTWFNFYFFMLSGATTMFDTYCSQAFGARQYKHVGTQPYCCAVPAVVNVNNRALDTKGNCFNVFVQYSGHISVGCNGTHSPLCLPGGA